MTVPKDQEYFGGKSLSECRQVITRHGHLTAKFSEGTEERDTMITLKQICDDLVSYVQQLKNARRSYQPKRPRRQSSR